MSVSCAGNDPDVWLLEKYRGGDFHIWVMRPDGRGVRQLTRGKETAGRSRAGGRTRSRSCSRPSGTRESHLWTLTGTSASTRRQIATTSNDASKKANPDAKQTAASSATSTDRTLWRTA